MKYIPRAIEYYIKNVKHKDYLKTVYKKIITIIISIITSIIAVIIFDKDLEAIVTSALLSIVFYDYIVKYIIKGVKNKTSKYNKNDDKWCYYSSYYYRLFYVS